MPNDQLQAKKKALVPTMGALHEGHLSLVEIARKHADLVGVSIFVNPLQFGPNEDFSKYPRTLEKDLELLKKLNVDYIFTPTVEEVYPAVIDHIQADSDIANRLCGINRPGHFDGVCTVVKRLFDLLKPDIAIFGEKDYQQLMVIQEMTTRLNLPIEIIGAPIIRESNGLAMSSRNQYLSESDKKLASNIYQTLSYLSSLNSTSEIDLDQAKNKLEKMGIKIEYLELHWDRIFIAARIGSTRLIDNVLKTVN